jgi:hypothetical protein
LLDLEKVNQIENAENSDDQLETVNEIAHLDKIDENENQLIEDEFIQNNIVNDTNKKEEKLKEKEEGGEVEIEGEEEDEDDDADGDGDGEEHLQEHEIRHENLTTANNNESENFEIKQNQNFIAYLFLNNSVLY